jgi:hypothetical protein
VLVIPGERLAECGQILASHFRDVRVYRLDAPECVRYKQVVVFGARRNRRERQHLTDSEIIRARLQYASLARNSTQLPVLASEPGAQYQVPPSGPVNSPPVCGSRTSSQVYSVRSASNGETKLARIAGIKDATIAESPRAPAATKVTTGSRGFIP